MKTKLITLLIAISSIVGIPAIAQNKELKIYNGDVVTKYDVADIDSMNFTTVIDAPAIVTSAKTGDAILINWSAVSQAEGYQLYRSGDNKNYMLLATNIAQNNLSYTDETPLIGANYYKVKTISSTYETLLSQATSPVIMEESSASQIETGLYMGVIGFNQALTTKDISILSTDTENNFTNFISSLTSKNGTLLYYAVDKAIDALATSTLPNDLVNVAMVTFTDGLDQGSFMMGGSYESNEEYLSAVNNKIKNTKVKGLPISAYSIGLRGTDVSDVAQFQSNLENLASSSENATEVNSMDEVNAKFQEIAEQLYKENSSQTISLTIPGQANGTKIRFTFDNVSDASKSQLYIEGTFSLSDRSLKNITYGGMDSSSGTIVAGVQDGIFVTFTFNDIKSANTNYETIPTNNIKQWSYIKSTSQWQQNSEFDPENQTEITIERKSAAIMLVLDCSSSLGSQFSTMKTHANAFIEKMAENTEKLTYNVSVTSSDPTMGTVTGSQLSVDPGASITITATTNDGYSFVNWTVNGRHVSRYATYTVTVTKDVEYIANFKKRKEEEENGHAYVDLGLSVKWATCNVGATTPEGYGDYFAWGETKRKGDYDWSTYKWCNGDEYSMTKYCTSSYYGTVDNKTTLELTDDAARVNWGGKWRMPTKAEYDELCNTSNCTWTWTTQNGVNGYKVTSKKNGNSIFLPAVGSRGNGGILSDEGRDGYYWSSSLSTGGGDYAYRVHFYSMYVGGGTIGRYRGQSVRAVCE